MPQMAPLWWLIMFLMFLTSSILMYINIHFQNNNKVPKTKTLTMKSPLTGWKW